MFVVCSCSGDNPTSRHHSLFLSESNSPEMCPPNRARISQACLDTIPSDILYQKNKTLLIIYAKTCESLALATRARSIWIYAARRDCRENHLYGRRLTFPTCLHGRLNS
ncbi:hypothetical protein BJ165DRAFT_1488874 [Panaeolus papilionaceus]|nr:hypothetical protein BJ165DRAFT_1488874 [Panaeolus papilionaceus]